MIIGIDASRANVAERTGTERYAWEVIRRIVPTLNNHIVRLYVREPLRNDFGDLGIHTEVRVLHWRLGFLWSHLRLSWEMLWCRPDILFVPADTVPIFHPKNTITTIHDVAFERFPELYQDRIQRRLGWFRPLVLLCVRIATFGRYNASERDYHRWSVRQAIRACRRILTVSEFSKREIIDTLKVEPERITVTPLGVRQAEYFQSLKVVARASTLKRLGLTRPFFLFLGRLETKKNIALTVQAYLTYRKQSAHPIDLVLVGRPGFGWDAMRSVVTDPAVVEFIHVLGWQSDDDVAVLQVSARALLFISQYEGFGIPALESLSAGVPVVASRHGSLPEVLGEAACFVDTENISTVVAALQDIDHNEELRQILIRRGGVLVRRYTWENTAMETRAVLMAAGLQ